MRAVLPLLAVLSLVPRAAWPQGNPLGPEFRVNTYLPGTQRAPDVSVATSNFVVVWTSPQPGVPGPNAVLGQRFDSGGAPLGPEFLVSTYTTNPGAIGQRHLPRVASDPSGNFIVVWESVGFDGSGLGVVGQRYASSGAPLAAPFVANSETLGNQYGPDVGFDGSGNFVVVWQHSTSGTLRVTGQRFASSGAPLGPEFLVITQLAGQTQQTLSVDSTGGFVVAWTKGSSIWAQRYAGSGAPLGFAFRVSEPPDAFLVFEPAVASDASGNFVVAWSDWYQGAVARRYASSGAPLGPQFLLPGTSPSVAFDAAGDFVVVWEGADGSGTGVYGQRFASSGVPLGAEFRVNSFTPDFQLNPSVAADPAGNFVVAWQSAGQDPQYGIYGQRYNMIVPVELMNFGVE
jgi:hypothetical protein